MGHRLDETLKAWMNAAGHASPLGPRAVEDALREVAGCQGIELRGVRVHRDGAAFRVSIRHRDAGAADDAARYQHTAFEFRTQLQPPMGWLQTLEWIRTRQAATPPHLAGLPVNVDASEYDRVLAEVRAVTGYDGLARGDLWVHACQEGDVLAGGPFSPPPHARPAPPAGTRVMGHLTPPGEIALRKYRQVKGLPE